MKILKFGGKSLANGQGIKNVISIIQRKVADQEKIIIVLSARGNTTDQLQELLSLARAGQEYSSKLAIFQQQQLEPSERIDLDEEFLLISRVLQGVKLLGDYSLKVQDLLLAQGEIMAVKTLCTLLKEKHIRAQNVDSRLFFKTDSSFGNAVIDADLSSQVTAKYFDNRNDGSIAVITGFIASNANNETTTLGRNGTNYSASLLANFMNVSVIESYTHVNGIYTANPEIVSDAKILEHVSYNEASELASFGAAILHAKSIVPLVDKNISLRILNTFDSSNQGTLINGGKSNDGIKSISVQEEVVLVSIVGKGLLGKIGIDARIFSSLGNSGINVSVISQGSSERGINFIISKSDAFKAERILLNEFNAELSIQDIQSITIADNMAVVTVVGQHIGNFAKSLEYLKRNKIDILLINNSIGSSNISIVISTKDVKKAVNTIHSQIFGAIKTINIAVVGKGTVGGALIDQILKSKVQIFAKKYIDFIVFSIAGSRKVLFDKNGVTNTWREDFDMTEEFSALKDSIIGYAKDNHLENLVLIDNTSSYDFVKSYTDFIENGFDVVSSNKIANTQKYSEYKELRQCLENNNASYLYETNVGAGLPIIDTIKVLHETGENITRIKGVFSGSLSYLFNSFSKGNDSFSSYLQSAIASGYTEPDPREDLCGNDVARKLLILARELGLENEFDDIEIENLVPAQLRKGTAKEFLENIEKLDAYYSSVKNELGNGKVLRYVGDLSGNLQSSKGQLKVELISVDENSALGNLKGSDSIFQIFTESYQDNPITIIGAGAGAEVTARGVFGDLLRIADKKY